MRKTKNRNKAIPKPEDPEPGDANYYDKIFKECWRKPSPELMDVIFKVPTGEFKPVHIEFQRTRERRTDFTGKWVAKGYPNTILHFEVHGRDEKKMTARMFDTAGLINWHYPSPKWDLIQTVLFIGEKRPTFATEIQKMDFLYRFRVLWVKDFDYQQFLKTGKLDLMLLAPLANTGGKPPEEVFVEVVNKAREIAESDLDFDRFVDQLHVLSNLHNLQQIFSKVMLNITSLINEKNDPFFQRGKKEGKLEGKLEGVSEKSLEVMVNLIEKSDHDDEFIASIVGLESETVEEVREIMAEHPNDFWERLKKLSLKIEPSKNGKSLNGH